MLYAIMYGNKGEEDIAEITRDKNIAENIVKELGECSYFVELEETENGELYWDIVYFKSANIYGSFYIHNYLVKRTCGDEETRYKVIDDGKKMRVLVKATTRDKAIKKGKELFKKHTQKGE